MATVLIDHFSVGHHEVFTSISYGTAYDWKQWSSGSNAAGKWSMYIAFSVSAAKTVKYVTFEITTQNNVGDPICCEVTKKSKQYLKFTGPITTSNTKIAFWDLLVYYSGNLRLLFGPATLSYSDGTSEEVDIILKEKINNVEYFKHYENELDRATVARGMGSYYKPKEYKAPQQFVFSKKVQDNMYSYATGWTGLFIGILAAITAASYYENNKGMFWVGIVITVLSIGLLLYLKFKK